MNKISLLSIPTVIAAATFSTAGWAAPQPAAKPAAAAAQQQPTRANTVAGLANNFKTIDTNKDGSLSAAELAVAEGQVQQRRLAAIRSRVEGEFTKLDTNKDGQLSKAEFMAAAPSSASATPNGAALLARLDSNKDGKVALDEYQAPVLASFDRVDTNKDGVISAAERQAQAKKK